MPIICALNEIVFTAPNGIDEVTLTPWNCEFVNDATYNSIVWRWCEEGVDFTVQTNVPADNLDGDCCMQAPVTLADGETINDVAPTDDWPIPVYQVINGDTCFVWFMMQDGTPAPVDVKPELSTTHGDATGTSVSTANEPADPPANKVDGNSHVECHDDGLAFYLCVWGAWVLSFTKRTEGDRTTYFPVWSIDFDNLPTAPTGAPADASEWDQHENNWPNWDIVWELQWGTWVIVDTDEFTDPEKIVVPATAFADPANPTDAEFQTFLASQDVDEESTACYIWNGTATVPDYIYELQDGTWICDKSPVIVEKTTYHTVNGVIDFDNIPTAPINPPASPNAWDQHENNYLNGDVVYEFDGTNWVLVDTDKQTCPAVTDIENFTNDWTNSTFDSPDESWNPDLHYEVAYIILEDGSQVLATETPDKANMPAYQSGNTFNFANTWPTTNNMTKVHEIYDWPDCATAVLISKTVKICQVKKFIYEWSLQALPCPLVFPFEILADNTIITSQADADAYMLARCPWVAYDANTCEYIRIVDEWTPPITDVPVTWSPIARIDAVFTDAWGNGDYDITTDLLGCHGQSAVTWDCVEIVVKDCTNGWVIETLTGKVWDPMSSFTTDNPSASSIINFVSNTPVTDWGTFVFAKKSRWRSQPDWFWKNIWTPNWVRMRQLRNPNHAWYNPIELQMCIKITPTVWCGTSENTDNTTKILTHCDFMTGAVSNVSYENWKWSVRFGWWESSDTISYSVQEEDIAGVAKWTVLSSWVSYRNEWRAAIWPAPQIYDSTDDVYLYMEGVVHNWLCTDKRESNKDCPNDVSVQAFPKDVRGRFIWFDATTCTVDLARYDFYFDTVSWAAHYWDILNTVDLKVVEVWGAWVIWNSTETWQVESDINWPLVVSNLQLNYGLYDVYWFAHSDCHPNWEVYNHAQYAVLGY